MRLRILALPVLLFAACGPRAPGPSDNELGKVFFWHVVDPLDSEFQNCTDRLAETIEIPTIAANTFVIYEVQDDGESALSMECDTTDAASCTEGPVVYTVDNHTVSVERPAEVSDVEGANCQLSIVQTLTYIDRGASLDIEVSDALSLVGDAGACELIDAEEKANSGNGEGLDGCTVALTTSADFVRTDRR